MKVLIVLTLVCALSFVSQMGALPISSIKVARAQTSDVTWEQVNQSIEKSLEDFWNNTVFPELEEILNTSESIYDEVEGLSDSINTTVYNYLNDNLNLSGENITINPILGEVDVNLSQVLNNQENILARMGEYDEGQSIYDDLSTVISGLVDKDGRFVLKDGSGNSALKDVYTNQQTIGENQKKLVRKISDEHNETRNTTINSAGDIKNKVEDSEQDLAGSVPWPLYPILAMVFFLVVWVLFLKDYMYKKAQRRAEGLYESDEDYFDEEEEEPDLGPVHTKGPKRSINPLSNSVPKLGEPTPDCYMDGKSYQEFPECYSCPYKDECAEEKIKNATLQKMEQKKEQMPSPDQMKYGETSTVDPGDLDLDDWGVSSYE